MHNIRQTLKTPGHYLLLYSYSPDGFFKNIIIHQLTFEMQYMFAVRCGTFPYTHLFFGMCAHFNLGHLMIISSK